MGLPSSADDKRRATEAAVARAFKLLLSIDVELELTRCALTLIRPAPWLALMHLHLATLDTGRALDALDPNDAPAHDAEVSLPTPRDGRE